MALSFRTVADDELPAYRAAMMATFGDDPESDPEGAARVRALIGPEQRWAAFDGGDVVATSGTFDHAIAMPGGGQLAMAGLTMVSVRPTHRRRGILRELMRLHLEDARRRGFPISGLWASEASIYQRFGYGIAAEGDAVEVGDARAVTFREPRELDAVVHVDEERARAELPAIYDRATAGRPGALIRSAAWWRERRFLEAPYMRAGASRRRHVGAVRGGALVGYLQFRQRASFTDGLPSGSLDIVELVGVDTRAEASLWQLALSADLFPRVTWWNAPVDDVLPWIVTDARRVKRRRTDTLWLRIEDVPAALSARRYAAGGALRLEVEGEAWDLVVEGDGGRARCARCAPGASAALGAGAAPLPSLRLSRPALGSLFLGGVFATQLARAGEVHGDPAAVAMADRLFPWPIAPWCPEIF
ncbi:MAG TPA: GNAT family N-acetyltransferase [Kofleriaceae bacterium]|nr:GNAT family N-acetyltransferase [Kofleriaceae bacterium]